MAWIVRSCVWWACLMSVVYYLVALPLAYQWFGPLGPARGMVGLGALAFGTALPEVGVPASAPLGVGQGTRNGGIWLGIFGLDVGLAASPAGQLLGSRPIRRGRCGRVCGLGHPHSRSAQCSEGYCLAPFNPRPGSGS